MLVITEPPNGPVLFCWLASVVVVCNAAGRPAGRRAGRQAAGRVGTRRGNAVGRRGWPGVWTVGALVADWLAD